jgi:ABC-type Mn2+/Zn2+ transport system ATPase subunit
MSGTRTLCTATELSVGFSNQPVLSSISLRIEHGMLICVLGPNGAGKSCLLRTLSGELPALAGRIERPDPDWRDRLGVVPQVTDLQLGLPITLREMVALGTAGFRDPFLREHLDQALATVALSDQALQRWEASSGGERQRTLIARALVRRPELLLLDEASSHLDAGNSDRLFASLRERCDADRLAVVAAVHDAELAQRWATHRFTIEAGSWQFEAVTR